MTKLKDYMTEHKNAEEFDENAAGNVYEEDEEWTEDEEDLCPDVDDEPEEPAKKLTRKEKFIEHCRLGHFHDRKLGDVGCIACLTNKSKRASHKKVRDKKFKHAPLIMFATDFFGPLEASYRGSRY